MGLYSNYGIDSLRENATYDIWSSDIDTSVLEKYDDIGDMGSEIIVQCEQNWATLIKTIGLSELADVENGVDTTTVIYEAGGLKGFFAAAKKFFKGLFDKVAALLKAIGLRLFGGCKDAKDFCEKYKKEINNIKVPDDFEYQGYEYQHLSASDTDYINSEEIKDLQSMSIKKEDAMKDTRIAKYVGIYKDNDKKIDEQDRIRGKILKGNSTIITEDDWAEEIFKYFRNGETEKVTIDKINPDQMAKDIMDSNNVKKAIDSVLNSYKHTNANVNSTLTKVEKNIDEMFDSDDITYTDEEKTSLSASRTAIQAAVEMIKFEYTCIVNVINAQFKALEDRNKEYKSVLIKLINKTRFNNLKKDESADFGMSHYSSAIENIQFI